MKALSLWQPWATLIAVGHKKVETRSWPTRYRGPIAIHAAKRKLTDDEHELLHELAYEFNINLPAQLQLGAIVAIASLWDCYQMSRHDCEIQTELEEHVGGWEPGRYAWCLHNVTALREPIPARGAQGLWQWEPTAAIEAAKETT